MSFGAAFDAKEQIRQAIDIVDLVGSYVQLRRNGRNYVALCPWHDDSRPSLQINPDRQSFKCWVCDYGGDVFSFVMRMENMEFREALELLAERAGIELKRPSQHFGEFEGTTPRPDDDKRTLLRVLAWAEDQFHRCLLHAPEGEPGRAYFAERGISQETIEKFHLGYAPMVQRWDWLLERTRNSEWSPSLLERVGLLRRKDKKDKKVSGTFSVKVPDTFLSCGGGHYDWFRGRAMFSIRDARSRPIAFGGRVLPQLADEKSAKYINSPETPLFSKSRELYALDVARDHFKNDGGAIVMEGYTDVLMAHQHGITNCVAVLGTALGERHLQLLRRYTETITLVLDGDAAGRRRTNEILDTLLALFEKNSVDLRILTLPEGIDPCDFIATHGSDSFRALLAQAVDALEHKFRSVTNGLDTLTDTHRASQAAEQLLATLAQIRPASAGASSATLLREEQMLGRIARKFHLPEDKLRSRLVAIRQEARGRRTSPYSADEREARGDSLDSRSNVPSNISELPTWDRSLLELVILDPSYLARVADVIDPATISSPVACRIFMGMCRLAKQGMHEDFGRLLAAYDEPDMKNLLVQLDESAASKTKADRERWLADLLDTNVRRSKESNDRATLAAARQSEDDEAMQLLARSVQNARPKHLSDYEKRKR